MLKLVLATVSFVALGTSALAQARWDQIATEGSEHIVNVNGCFERQNDLPGGPNPVGTAPLPSPCIRSQTGNPCEPDNDGAAIQQVR